MTRIGRAALTGLAVAALGCGVPGLPLPPGPIPPAAPSDVRVLSTPEGLEVHATRPQRDIDGAPLKATPGLQLFANDPRCSGTPVATAQDGPLRWSARPSEVVLHVTAALGDRRGPPTAAITARWAQPPAPPEAPIGFNTPDKTVQIAWLPPEGQGGEMVILRDGAIIGRAPLTAAQFVDPAPAGERRYTLMVQTRTARSGPSPAVVVAP